MDAPPFGRTLLLALGLATMAAAAEIPNYDETKVPAYTLPDPLVRADGSRVGDAAAWPARRAELLRLFAENMYGVTPVGRPADLHWKLTTIDRTALAGRATRKEITIWFARGEDGPRMHLLVYVPNGVARPPLFLGLNFEGNQTVDADPGIAIADPWGERGGALRDEKRPVRENPRGADASRWQFATVIARGYATATAYRGDLFPDDPGGRAGSVASLFDRAHPGGPPADAWGAIGVWAWGLSRALDVLREDPDIDASHVVVHGHSRLGKAALWAGAQDERFGLVISNCSGCAGAALNRRAYGETVGMIGDRFPYWFAPNFRRFARREGEMPVDQHELLALIAPRPLYVASAADDRWADPHGEFLAAQAAGAVYALFNRAGVGSGPMPAVGHPVGDCVRYHIRPGPHDITAYDWAQYLDFADRWLKRR